MPFGVKYSTNLRQEHLRLCPRTRQQPTCTVVERQEGRCKMDLPGTTSDSWRWHVHTPLRVVV
ncbi:unnamed protein product [Mycena citricolor]|uniref:Uncharacterized protein n=1 Tax=Mycena citricolor TaxID=2018698 RepID=A0AAD2JV16_9AGAR|nr:unnamed protein product [Mycena citricolor]